MTTLAHRSRMTICINPEAPRLWGAGGNDMLRYAPNCYMILQANTLSELIAAVEKLLMP